jgi:hypothetical protein
MKRPAAADIGAAAALALLTVLPFLGGLLQGHAFYFRDLAGQFFPFRRFIVDGLRHGELRYWNPLVYEGVPLSLPPLGYPLDLLQMLLPGEWGMSVLLAAHLPLAAVSLFLLGRHWGLSPLAAATGGAVYALGGFGLSTLNLYVYVQALAWAPLAILTLLRASRGPRQAGLAGLTVAILLSTIGAEIALQAIVAGVLLALCSREARTRGGLARLTGSLALAAGLAAPVLVFMRGLMAESERAAGFADDVVLSQSIHPLALAQVVVGDWFGDLHDLVNHWWGMNFFPRGFPYILSLYLGWPVLVLAVAGLFHRTLPARALALLGAFALWVSIGRFAGFETLIRWLPFTHAFRFPCKAFFLVHLVAALLAAAGIDLLRGGARRPWLALVGGLAAGGLLLAAAPLLPSWAPRSTVWFARGFFPPDVSWAWRGDALGRMLVDAQAGGLVALAGAGVALAVVTGKMTARRGSALVAALVAGDLLRTGAGLNAMVSASFYTLSPGMRRLADDVRDASGRVFTCDVLGSAAYIAARGERAFGHETWTFAVGRETFTPFANMNDDVPTAYGLDRTMLVPTSRVFTPEEALCGGSPWQVGALRRAAVTHVLSLDPLQHPELKEQPVQRTASIAPLAVHVYTLDTPLPRYAVARRVLPAASREAADRMAAAPGFGASGATAVEAEIRSEDAEGTVLHAATAPGAIELDVTAKAPTVVLVREGYAEGWTAQVNDRRAPVLRADGRHLAVPVPAGSSHVSLHYAPLHLGAASALAAFAVVLASALGRRLLRPRLRGPVVPENDARP